MYQPDPTGSRLTPLHGISAEVIQLTRRQFRLLISLNVFLVIALVFTSLAVLQSYTPIPLTGGQIRPTDLGSRGRPLRSLGPANAVTPTPGYLGGETTLAFALRQNGRSHLWVWRPGDAAPERLTAGAWDDRDPAFSPDGSLLAFASNRSGYWNLYVLELASGELRQLTSGPGFKANPSWSPDGQWLAYESYRDKNFDIYVWNAQGRTAAGPARGQTGPFRLTSHPAPDYAPSWSPDGRTIAFVSARTGRPDIWAFSLDAPEESQARNLTETPDVQENNPTFSPDGNWLAYSASRSGLLMILVAPASGGTAETFPVTQGDYPAWSPGGGLLAGALQGALGESLLTTSQVQGPGAFPLAVPLEGLLGAVTWVSGGLPGKVRDLIDIAEDYQDQPLWDLAEAAGLSAGTSGLVSIPGVNAPDPRLSGVVADSFIALRQRVVQEAGWDLLGNLDSALAPLDLVLPPATDAEEWLRTGRAFHIQAAAMQAGWVQVAREDLGQQTYWRVYLESAQQDGSMGEPLRSAPWNFDMRFSGNPTAYDNGGAFRTDIPSGYFVDFTQLADDYGWERATAGPNWRAYYRSIRYWEFRNTGGLNWGEAMRELYPEDALATPTPFLSPTPTSTPTATATRTPWPSSTPIPSRTPRPTSTPVLTGTPSPTASSTPTDRAIP